MSYRPRLIIMLSLLVLLTLVMSACNRERPVPATTTTTPAAARGTVAAPAAGAGTQVAVPTTSGAGGAAPTPSAPSPQQVVVSPAAGGAATGQVSTYTVVAGDTLATIAARFGTTTEAISQLNSLADPNALTLGQKLQIPAAGSQGAAASTGGAAPAAGATGGGETRSATSTYTVQAGDTLGKIAQRFGTTVAELQRLNNITNPDVLTLGQKLVVPGSGGAAVAVPTGGQGRTYTVQRGDTLLSIARRFGLTVKQLQTANNIANPDRIAVGQKLIIP